MFRNWILLLLVAAMTPASLGSAHFAPRASLLSTLTLSFALEMFVEHLSFRLKTRRWNFVFRVYVVLENDRSLDP